jgi:hypothetical protein
VFDSAEDYGIPVPRMAGSDAIADIQWPAAAACSIVIDKCLSRIFVAAYLLTGSAEQPEKAMLESTQQLNAGATHDGCPPWKAIVAAIMRRCRDSVEAIDEALTILPIELRRVLWLSPRLRQCFVLRVLMAMPRQYCAGLLGIDAEEVDASSGLAAQELATFVTPSGEELVALSKVHCKKES